MASLSKNSVIQLGAITTFFNGLLVELAKIIGIPTDWQSIVTHCIPAVAFIVSVLFFLLIQSMADFTIEDRKHLKNIEKDKKRCKKVLANTKSTDAEIAAANSELVDICTIEQLYSKQRREKLAKESLESSTTIGQQVLQEAKDPNP